MATKNQVDIRAEVVALLLDIVANERYPSVTMLRMIEQLADPEERGLYARILMDNIRSSPSPSIPMMRRLVALG
ncbi:hypothetical protein ACVW00_003195 [Marmoricola sp. URHA0025 HA25]